MSAPVDLEQFREPVQAWKDKVLLPLSYSDHDAERHAKADHLLCVIAKAARDGVEVRLNFPQVGTAGPFPVVDGAVTLPDATMNDLIHHARAGYVPKPSPVVDDAQELPPLPDAELITILGRNAYTATQMQKYARAAIYRARETQS